MEERFLIFGRNRPELEFTPLLHRHSIKLGLEVSGLGLGLDVGARDGFVGLPRADCSTPPHGPLVRVNPGAGRLPSDNLEAATVPFRLGDELYGNGVVILPQPPVRRQWHRLPCYGARNRPRPDVAEDVLSRVLEREERFQPLAHLLRPQTAVLADVSDKRWTEPNRVVERRLEDYTGDRVQLVGLDGKPVAQRLERDAAAAGHRVAEGDVPCAPSPLQKVVQLLKQFWGRVDCERAG